MPLTEAGVFAAYPDESNHTDDLFGAFSLFQIAVQPRHPSYTRSYTRPSYEGWRCTTAWKPFPPRELIASREPGKLRSRGDLPCYESPSLGPWRQASPSACVRISR